MLKRCDPVAPVADPAQTTATAPTATSDAATRLNMPPPRLVDTKSETIVTGAGQSKGLPNRVVAGRDRYRRTRPPCGRARHAGLRARRGTTAARPRRPGRGVRRRRHRPDRPVVAARPAVAGAHPGIRPRPAVGGDPQAEPAAHQGQGDGPVP